ncbi:MAG: hypothetical protein IPL26_15845 [Leptospiraceae bacterium]|nr:hypothetical protein [Leptospiraceae bacterium]
MTLINKISITLSILFFAANLAANDKKKSNSLVYKGGWFEVEYPKEFTVKPSIPSSMPNLYDSAFFISPDKKVKFYVFSPQWSGEATDISLDPSKEIEKDTKTETKNGMKHKWYTFESKDGSKLRSYQETTNAEETTKLILGIEYADRESYKKNKDAYLKFKKSIKQFAD